MPTESLTRSKIANRAPRLRTLFLLLPLCAHGNERGLAQATPSKSAAGAATSPTDYTASSPAPRTSHHAEIIYKGDLLTVNASNASLNQILREIARQTGMKITGGVADDRVFGNYGPASPAVVLATLLDGSGSNLLIVQNAAQQPTELVLTPRVGRVTAPNPNAPSFEDNDNSADDVPPAPVRSAPPPPAQSLSSQGTNSRAPNRSGTGGIDTNPAATAPSSTTQQLAFPPIDATNPPATATTTPNTPDPTSDSVKTPQQIFEQLQRLRQQQTQQPPQQ